MTQWEFDEAQRRLEKRVTDHKAREEAKPDELYFTFANNEERQKAIKIIGDEWNKPEETRSQLFRFLTNWGQDPLEQKKTIGLKMSFMRHPEGLSAKVAQYFKDNGLKLAEHDGPYEVTEPTADDEEQEQEAA